MRNHRSITAVCLLVSMILLPINASVMRSAFGDTQNPVDPDLDEVEFCYRTLYGNTCDGPGVVQTSSCSTTATCKELGSDNFTSFACVFIQPPPPFPLPEEPPEFDGPPPPYDGPVQGATVWEVENRSGIMTTGETTEGQLERRILYPAVSCQIVYSCDCNVMHTGCERDGHLYDSTADVFESMADGEYCNMEWEP